MAYMMMEMAMMVMMVTVAMIVMWVMVVMVQLWWVSRSGSSRGTNLPIIANHNHYCIQLAVVVACALLV